MRGTEKLILLIFNSEFRITNSEFEYNTAYENRKELLCESLMHEKPSPSMIIWNTADEVRRKYSALLEKTGGRI